MSSLALLEPSPSALWPLALVRAMEDRQGEAVYVLTLSLTTELHYSDVGIDDDALGTVEPLVARWPSDLFYGVHESEYRLRLPSFEVEIEDPEGTLGAILTGSDAIGTYRAAAKIRVGVPGTASNLWGSIFEGIIADWATPRRDVVKLVLRHDYAWLKRQLLRHRLLKSDWPYAHEFALNKLLPVNVGTFDSRLDNGASALPTLYADTRNAQWIFLIQRGTCYDLFDIRLNGTILDPATDYTFVFDTRGGLQFTAVQLTADPGADPVVTVDITGLDRIGDGSGAPLETPAAQLQHLLCQFGHGDWLAGAWLDQTLAPLDFGSFAEADDYLEANRSRPKGTFSLNAWTQGRRTGRAISTGIWTLDLVNEWCGCFGGRPYWTEAGKLALGFFDHRARRVFLEGAHWIRDEDMTTDGARQVPNVRRQRDELEAAPLSVRDGLAGWNSEEAIPVPWCAQPITEADLLPYVTTDEPTPWNVVGGGADPHEAILDPVYAPDDALTYAEWDAASATGTFRVRCRWASGGPAVPAGTVVSVLVYWRARYVANGGGAHTMKVGLKGSGATDFGGDQTLTTDWVTYVNEWTTNPDTTNPWTMDEIALLQAEVSATHTASQDKPQITQLWMTVQFSAGGAAADLVRERLSRELLLASRPRRITEVGVNLHRAAIRACDPVSISSDAVQAPGLLGWGVETWERRPHFMLSRSMNLNNPGEAVLRLVDARDLLVPLWELDQASAPGPEAPGVVRLGSWPASRTGLPDGRRLSRPTDPTDGDPTGIATINAPAGGTYTVQQDLEKYIDVGLQIDLQSGAGPVLEKDVLFFRNRHDSQVWPIEGGTAVFSFVVPTLTAGTIRTIYRCGSDVLELDVDAALLIFRRSVGGTDYEASISTSGLVAGETATVAARWTSREQELVRLDADENEEAVPRWTLDVWLNGTKGTPVTAVEGFMGDLYVGSDAGADQLASILLSRRCWRQILTDDEVVAETAALT